MDNFGIFLRKIIEIVAIGDTNIINYQLSIIHFYRTNGAINRDLTKGQLARCKLPFCYVK